MEEFVAAHRKNGLPIATQRRAVLEVILNRGDYPTVDGVYRASRGAPPRISRGAVHRIARAFVPIRMLTKTCHQGSSARFDPKLCRHHHLVRLVCVQNRQRKDKYYE